MKPIQRGVPGVWTYGFYDGWVPNYLFWIAETHNSFGRFYEVQSLLWASNTILNWDHLDAGKKETKPQATPSNKSGTKRDSGRFFETESRLV
jgi:hypothetical protein